MITNQKEVLIANKLCSGIKDFTTEQYRLFYALLRDFRWNLEKDPNIKTLEFLQYQIVEMLGKKKLRFKQLKQIIKTMPHNFSVFNSSSEDIIFIFDKISIKDIEVDGFNGVTFYFNESVKEYLIDLIERFSCINLEEIKLLKSRYSFRLYELCSQFSNQQNYLMPYKQLRTFFNIPESHVTSDIDKSLNIAKKEINSKTKYHVEIRKAKAVRRVTHYHFKITKQVENNNKNNCIENNTINLRPNVENNFDLLWSLYPIKKNKADVKYEDMLNLYKYGYDVIRTCIGRYIEFIEERRKEFNQAYQNGDRFFTKGYIDYLDENYEQYKAEENKKIDNSKPIQSTNFEQREYTDEFFEGLYDNF